MDMVVVVVVVAFECVCWSILQLLLFLVLVLLLAIVIGLVDIVVSGLTALFAQALDELGKTIEGSLAVVVDDLIGALGEQLDGREALDLDVFEFVLSGILVKKRKNKHFYHFSYLVF